MTWNIDFKESALSSFSSFPKNIQKTIKRAIDERLIVNPFQHKMLKGELKGARRFRTGNYRIIYVIYPDEKVIEISAIDTRSKIYKKT